MNTHHEANRRRWNAGANDWKASADARGIWRRCHKDPSLVFAPKILARLEDISGKAVCVLGSGDNQAVFAMAGLGANVTSVDISENQLAIAAERAETLGLSIAFVRQDVTHLDALADQSFDLVYTGGHVAVWVSDLTRYYSEAARVLKPGGTFIVDEYHPFRRVWAEIDTALEIKYPYDQRGPFEFEASEDISGAVPGTLPTYEYHWTVADILQAILDTGCALQHIHEYGDRVDGWEPALVGGLPENLLIVSQKPGP